MFTRMLHACRIIGALIFLVASVAEDANAQFQSLPASKYAPGARWKWAPTCGAPAVDAATAASVQERLHHAENEIFVNEDLQIPVVVHLITSGKKGKYPRAVVDLMIDNMNVAFSGTGFSFYLARLDYTNNRKWYESCGIQQANEAAMKKRLAYYPAQALNIYSCKPVGKGLPAGLIGYAYFPWMYPENSYMQGVVVHPGTLPTGAGIPNYDYYGLNVVHEAGHWLGLYHTFHPGTFGIPSSCAEPGDEVADTPVQNLPTGECVQEDSCPQAGIDDLHNLMNYVDDHCYEHFTPQQGARMRAVAVAYRPSLF